MTVTRDEKDIILLLDKDYVLAVSGLDEAGATDRETGLLTQKVWELYTREHFQELVDEIISRAKEALEEEGLLPSLEK